jgi:uncharacterized protein YodC (DUF2158 family)
MSKTNEFKIGDVVQLKSGGPKMTVTWVTSATEKSTLLACAWFDNTKTHLYRENLSPETLRKIS